MTDGLDLIFAMLERHFVLVALIMVGSLFVRRRAAAIQHRFWLLGFVWVALLPLLVLRVPQYTTGQIRPDFSQRYAMPSTPTSKIAAPAASPAQTAPLVSATSAAVAPAPSPSPSQGDPIQIWQVLKWVYALGVILGLARVGASLLGARRLVPSDMLPARRPLVVRLERFALSALASVPPDSVVADLRAAARATGLKQLPRLIVNPAVPVPLTFWLVRHTIVTPSEDVSRAVLVHECAHIKRRDWFAQLFCRLVCSVFWFDPLLMLVERRMRALSEAAADDFVVNAGVEPTRYAEELVSIATGFKAGMLEPGLAIVGNGDLKARIALLLRPGVRTTRIRLRWMLATAATGAVLAIGCAALHYRSGTIPTANDGLVVLPNGKWIRLIGVIGPVNGHQEAWNLHGDLYPSYPGDPSARQEIPWPKGTDLLFETNLQGTTGVELGGFGDPGTMRPTQKDVEIQPQFVNGRNLWCVRVDLPKSAETGVTMLLPVNQTPSPATVSVYFSGIPTRPSSGRVVPAVAPSGVVYHEAQNGRFRFSTGEEIWLRSVNADGPVAGVGGGSWTIDGVTVPDTTMSASSWRRVFSAFETGTAGEHGPHDVRLFHFTFLPSGAGGEREFAREGLGLFDAAGNQPGGGGYTWVEPKSTETYLPVYKRPDDKPQDFVVRIADPTRATARTLPIHSAYSSWTFKASKTSWDRREIKTYEVSASRLPALTTNLSDTTENLSLCLIDAHGHRIDAMFVQSDGTRDTYTIPQSAGHEFSAVKIVTKPYIYVRFPNVWVNPKFAIFG